MLDIFFITSNRSKIDHARYLCSGYNVNILKQKQYGIGYIEPRILDREKLLDESIHDAINRLKKVTKNFDNLFVIIEDTSLIIEALSTPEKEYPGLDVKYWMENTNFQDIDFLLKQSGNNRNVIVRSDVILFLPKSLQMILGVEYAQFTGISNGTITEKEFSITTQELYPWLSSKTFNKWFTPPGENVPISLLEIEKANLYDFRKGAFEQMLTFLKVNRLVKLKSGTTPVYRQLNLFDLSLFIVCGKTCSGKTTISDYLTRKYGFYHIEASDFMYLSYYEKHGQISEVPIGDFAKTALKSNSSIVVDQIINHLENFKKGLTIPIVISGFRDPDEIKNFKLKYKGDLEIIEIFIDAKQELRFKRCLKRGRNDKVKTAEDFGNIDKQQESMGLLEIKRAIDDENIIANNKSFEEYYDVFEKRYSETLQYLNEKITTQGTINDIAKFKPRKLEHAILISMSLNREQYLTTTQVAHLVNSTFKYERKKGKDNISRFFNQKYYPYFEIVFEKGKLKYRLSQSGYSLSQILIQEFNKN